MGSRARYVVLFAQSTVMNEYCFTSLTDNAGQTLWEVGLKASCCCYEQALA